jgi:hypothetical protein
MHERFKEIGESVFFTKKGMCFHRSFIRRFYGLSIPKARKALKALSHSQQDEIIHYLKQKKTIK